MADMYPGTDYPHYREQFDTLDELTAAVEATDSTLNQIQSWIVGCRACDILAGDHLLWGEDERCYLYVLLFMPRKTQVTEFRVEFDTAHVPHDDIDSWLNGYVRQRVLAWYGFEER